MLPAQHAVYMPQSQSYNAEQLTNSVYYNKATEASEPDDGPQKSLFIGGHNFMVKPEEAKGQQ